MEEGTGLIPWKDILRGSMVVSFFCLSPGTIPILGSVIGIFTLIPILFYLVKLGWGYGLAVLGIALIFSIFLWPLFGSGSEYFLVEMFILGPVLFSFLKRGFSITKTVGYATGLLILLLSAYLILWGIKTGHNPYQAVVSEINQSMESSLRFYEQVNLPETTVGAMRDALQDIRILVARFWPGFAAASLLVLVWMNVWIGNRILERYGSVNFQFGDLSRWSLPEIIVWLVILGAGLALLPYPGLQTAGINILIFFALAYFFQGLAIVSFYLKKYRFSRFKRILLYSLIWIQTYMIIIVALAGLFDIWADFRRLKKAAD
ncbi:MAG TPA: DUF2232 domain-containing protein [Proteobacteria bacterium]|nr:DUF2232 domain-containing protein [Pseudomonadota bacterium]